MEHRRRARLDFTPVVIYLFRIKSKHILCGWGVHHFERRVVVAMISVKMSREVLQVPLMVCGAVLVGEYFYSLIT